MKCVQAARSPPRASKNKYPAVSEARKICKAKFQLTNIEGGIFSLKLNSKEKRGSGNEGGTKTTLNMSGSNSNVSDGVPARDPGHGKNPSQFKNIEIMKTPQKRRSQEHGPPLAFAN